MPASTIAPTRDHAIRIVELLSHGLVAGLGKPEPGKMCVEAAVCFALGLPHGGQPTVRRNKSSQIQNRP